MVKFFWINNKNNIKYTILIIINTKVIDLNNLKIEIIIYVKVG